METELVVPQQLDVDGQVQFLPVYGMDEITLLGQRTRGASS